MSEKISKERIEAIVADADRLSPDLKNKLAVLGGFVFGAITDPDRPGEARMPEGLLGAFMRVAEALEMVEGVRMPGEDDV